MSLVIDVDEIIMAMVGTSSRPESWTQTRLGDIGTILNGFAFPSARFSKSRGTPLIRIRDVGSASTVCYYDGTFDPSFLIHRGDLLVGMDGEFKAARWAGPNALLNQRVCKIDVDSRFFESRFLDLILPAYLRAIHGNTSSQTVTHLSSKTLLELPLPLPPLAEQRRIVEKMEALLARVSAARERLERVPRLLKRFRQAVLAAACEGRLTKEWGDSQVRLRARDESEDSGLESGVEAPWPHRPLAELCDPSRPITYGVIKLGSEVAGGIPTLRSSNVRPLTLDLAVVKSIASEISGAYPRTLLRGGEVLVTVRGTLGGVAVVPIELRGHNVSREVAVVAVEPPALPEFVALWIASRASVEWLAEREKGAAYTGINIEDLRQLPTPVPPAIEQQEVVKRVRALFAHADAIERRVIASLARVEKLPQAILSRAFAGELVPTEAELARAEDRDYETADALLDRIRNEREVEVAPRQRQAAPNGRKRRWPRI